MTRFDVENSALCRTLTRAGLALFATTVFVSPAAAATPPQVTTVVAGPWSAVGTVDLDETAVGVDDRGNATAVWLSPTSLQTQSLDVVAAQLPYGSTTWSSPTTIEPGHTTIERQAFGVTSQLRLAVDGGGRAVASWSDAFDAGTSGPVPIANGGNIYAARVAVLPAGATQWNAPTTLGAGQSVTPIVAFGSGVATALWTAPPTKRSSEAAAFARLAPTASTWSPPQSVRPGPEFIPAFDGDGLPALAVSPSGAAVAAWSIATPQGGLRVTTRARGSASWSPAHRLSSIALFNVNPQVAVGPDGTAAVVWVDGAGHVMVSVKEARASDWSKPKALVRRKANVGGEHVAIGRKGAILVSWTELDGDRPRGLLATRNSAKAPWHAADLSIGGSTGYGPRVATDTAGDAALTWLTADGNATLATRAAGSSQWSQPVTLGPADGTPRLVLSPAGRGIASWPTGSEPTSYADPGSAVLHAATFSVVPGA